MKNWIDRITASVARLLVTGSLVVALAPHAWAQSSSVTLNVVSATDGAPIGQFRYLLSIDNTGRTTQRIPTDGCSPASPGYPASCLWTSIAGVPGSSPIYTQGDPGRLPAHASGRPVPGLGPRRRLQDRRRPLHRAAPRRGRWGRDRPDAALRTSDGDHPGGGLRGHLAGQRGSGRACRARSRRIPGKDRRLPRRRVHGRLRKSPSAPSISAIPAETSSSTRVRPSWRSPVESASASATSWRTAWTSERFRPWMPLAAAPRPPPPARSWRGSSRSRTSARTATRSPSLRRTAPAGSRPRPWKGTWTGMPGSWRVPPGSTPSSWWRVSPSPPSSSASSRARR